MALVLVCVGAADAKSVKHELVLMLVCVGAADAKSVKPELMTSSKPEFVTSSAKESPKRSSDKKFPDDLTSLEIILLDSLKK